MPSANGWKLDVDGYEVTAAWRAPWFVLYRDDADEPAEPLLIHCENAEHALCHRRSGILLTADFERADWAQLEAS